jgi:uncharacterized protein YqgC (DUF456 family)
MKSSLKKKKVKLMTGLVVFTMPSVIFASNKESITDSVIKFSAQHYFLTSFIILIIIGLLARYISLKSAQKQSGISGRIGVRAMLRRRKRSVV